MPSPDAVQNTLACLRPNLRKTPAKRRAGGVNSCAVAQSRRFKDFRHLKLNECLQIVPLGHLPPLRCVSHVKISAIPRAQPDPWSVGLSGYKVSDQTVCT